MILSEFVFVAVLPVAVLMLSLTFGPLPLVVRGLIRGTLGPHYVHLWYRSASVGVATGMVLAAVMMSVLDGGQTLHLVLLCLLFLLATIDWQWRWLPIEWTLGVIGLGLIHAGLSGNVLQVLLQIVVPCLTILAMRQVLLIALKKEALGLGDIWLIAGLGAFLPIFESYLMIGMAALSGLGEVLLRKLFSTERQKTTSVSYGTHLCAVFLILRSFTQIN